jgi:hypothetical protein
MTARAGEMEKIADVAKPLYDNLDDAQKRRFGMLFHIMMGMRGHMGHMDEHPSDHEDGEQRE